MMKLNTAIKLFTLSIAILSTANASDDTLKRYTIKSGEILYQITGAGDVMGIKTVSTGTKSLIFTDYGTKQREEEQSQEITTGTQNDTKNIHTLEQLDNITNYKVDFKRHSIIKSTDQMAIMYLGQNMGETAAKTLRGFGGKKTGQTDNVQGYDCSVWEIMGAKQCMYKDQIPLWIETDMMGLKNKITAVSVKFDVKISDNAFELPDYPVQDMTMNEEQIQQMRDMGKMMQDTQANLKKQGKALNQASEADVQAALAAAMSQNKGMQSELEKMKVELPQMVQLGKAFRSCLADADSKAEAQHCEKTIAEKAKQLGLEDDEDMDDDFGSWSAAEKKAYLQEFDKDFAEMEKMLPCIQKANSMMDIMGCSQ